MSFDRSDLANEGEVDDTEAVSVAQPKRRIHTGEVSVPEAKRWPAWRGGVDDAALDLCKRCGPDVCSYVRKCFDFAASLDMDSAVGVWTELQHVFFDGMLWHAR